MKSKTITFIVSVLIVFVALTPMMQVTNAQELEGNSLLTDTNPHDMAISSTAQRKSFYAQGRFWVFYRGAHPHYGLYIVYRSSVDGRNWTKEAPVKTNNEFYTFSLWFDGTYVHYVDADYWTTGDENVYYQRGRPNADGTIDWSPLQIVLSGQLACYCSIAVDSNGCPWIAYQNQTGMTLNSVVIKSQRNDGVWETASGFPYVVDSSYYNYGNILVSLSNSKMYVLFANVNVYGRFWDGYSWGDKETVGSANGFTLTLDFSAVTDNKDNIHVVWTSSNNEIKYRRCSPSTGWGIEETIVSFNWKAGDSTLSGSLSLEESTGNLYVFWGGSPELGHIYYKKMVSSVWDSNFVDWIDVSPEPYYMISSSYKDYDGTIEVMYSTGRGTIGVGPWSVYFAWLKTATTNPNLLNFDHNTILVALIAVVVILIIAKRGKKK